MKALIIIGLISLVWFIIEIVNAPEIEDQSGKES